MVNIFDDMFFIATIFYIVKFDFEISQEFNANRFINWIINGKKMR